MKRCRVFLTRLSEDDANDIWRLIAEDNHQAAEAFLDVIKEASNLLSTTPEIGSPRYFSHPELQGLRFLPLRKFEKYLLFYVLPHLEDEEAIEIVQIVHGARDLPKLFSTNES